MHTTVSDRSSRMEPAARSRPLTLRELGVSAPFAAELEAMLRRTGHVRGDRIMGFSFRSTDGVRQELRAERAA